MADYAAIRLADFIIFNYVDLKKNRNAKGKFILSALGWVNDVLCGDIEKEELVGFFFLQ